MRTRQITCTVIFCLSACLALPSLRRRLSSNHEILFGSVACLRMTYLISDEISVPRVRTAPCHIVNACILPVNSSRYISVGSVIRPPPHALGPYPFTLPCR